MFKLPERFPNRHSGTHELADYVEASCLIKRNISSGEIVKYLIQIDDNDINSGINDADEIIQNIIDDVMLEVERRFDACAGGYPFVWRRERNNEILTLHTDAYRDAAMLTYIYLLLSNRLDMSVNRVHAEIDGTALLERVSKNVLGGYLGPCSRSMRFGTSGSGGFRERLRALCEALGEGGGLRNRGAGRIHAQDGGLDVVGWIPFADGRAGKLIVFGQCKTGTGWRDHLSKLRPLEFSKKWLSEPILVEPIRAHFIAEAVDDDEWNDLAISAGLLFDRCRLVEYGANLPEPLLTDLAAWTGAAREWVAEAMDAA